MRGSSEDDGDLVVETRGLTKRYGRVLAVDGVDLHVRRGEIYGFLGRNGAGKTTTLRMLLGLIRPTAGEARVLGQRPGDPAVLSRIGSLVETPAFYPFLSGMDNLRGVASYAGIRAGRGRLREVLEQVGLGKSARTKFRKYSLGMKQRLGVAAALLKDPELLVLDEPTNGLDPQGITEMRTLIRSLREEGRTVLLSSHLMSEVEQVCDRVGIISRGRLVAEGSVEDLRGVGGLVVRAEPLGRAGEILRSVEGVGGVEVLDGELRLAAAPEAAPAVARALVESGMELLELRVARRSLEEAFFELAGEREGEGGT
ncbi:MAG: ABC transporter ATP-binding protein [Rubrobacteraceae bacterium]|nr:ABC transporter ATP-binding protein [Rubrobacteraceae bacterium]MCL6438374.1 ABC transporter ATP-binding protein [Rubrobacteraceae bacterium]